MSLARVAERRAVYELKAAVAPGLATSFDLLSKAPKGVAKLRELILSLAVQGKLVEQRDSDEPASVLLRKIKLERENLLAAGEIKRTKPSAPVSDDELPYETPLGWQWLRLGELLSKIGAGSTPLGGRDVYTKSGVKFLRSQNVWDSGLALDNVAYIPKAVHERMAGTRVIAGDLLFNITGASIGRCALVPSDFDEANVSQHVTIIRPILGSIRQFLHLVLISSHVQQTVMDVQVGVSREGLSIGKLGQFVVPLPPLAEQARIVARVEELMQFCDALESHGRLQDEQHARLVATLFDALAASESAHALAENWQRIAAHFDLLLDRPEAVDTLEQTIQQLAVRGLLIPQDPTDEPASELLKNIQDRRAKLRSTGKNIVSDSRADPAFTVPAGWEAVGLLDLCAVGGGATPSKGNEGYWNGDVPWVSPKDMKVDLIEDSQDHVSSKALKETRLPLVPENSLLVVVRGMILVHSFPVAVTAREVTLNQDMKSFTPYIDGLTKFLALALKGFKPEILSLVARSTHGTCKLESEKLFGFTFGLPPLAEQHRIVARVEQLRRLCNDLRERLQQACATQSQLAEALVSAAAQSPAC